MNTWLNFFRRKKPFKPFTLPDTEYRVVPAFTLGGVNYYQFDNDYQVPSGRQMGAIAIYNEMQMKVDREYLTMHVNAMDRLLAKQPTVLDLTNMARLNMHLKERLDLMVMPDFVYKLASVLFFDETESPYFYNPEYNEKKIALWKASDGTLDFFLQMPLEGLIPSLNGQPVDLRTYLPIADQVAKIHQQLLTDISSGVV